ncbi:glycoside hydrolase family 127 protein [Lapidilactobacillus luobeiensis]|uniref:glycoside hydrolase family 127 protein n=1 Tax=Lapidilactobacillus luobeiensis TaxID=2950371 RepID=UPI0021C3AD83|nr:beta-L-arabinofuranosidase domain-containing protein [Lapidilactobacillus luobeiensis]
MQQPKIKVTDAFWQQYRHLVKDVMIPYQWSVINDDATVEIEQENANSYKATEKSHAIQNLKIAAGRESGDFYGFWFQDSDVYKWLEAVAYALRYQPDQQLQQIADDLVDLISQAQEPDGYLDTFFQLQAPQEKFQHISFGHELYCMGHYIEAGIAYFETTGNTLALTIATKMADCINTHFGPQPDKLHGYPGHPEVELALAKLADTTNDQRYRDLAAYLINQRGQQSPNFFAEQNAKNKNKQLDLPFPDQTDPADRYFQNDRPIRELDHAEGHAVRMTYLLTGMAHVARQTQDDDLLATCQRLWRDIVDKQMYVTGGIGATVAGEAFTYDYDLPNDTMYCETCASCAMVFFAKQMLANEPDGDYADVMERELYNGTISGMSLDAQHFFYVNPLEVDPQASAQDPTKSHVKVQRPAWFGCACCPPNLARLIASVDQYIYTIKDDTIYSNQFIANHADFGDGLQINQSGNYPWSGQISYQVSVESALTFAFALRIPAWSQENFTVKLNGHPVNGTLKRGYLFLNQTWSGTTTIEVDLDLSVRTVRADQHVTADLGKIAVQRGPVVYCAEETDNGKNLAWLSLPVQPDFQVHSANQGLAVPNLKTITTNATKLVTSSNQTSTALYTSDTAPRSRQNQQVTLIPYFAWANRQAGEMRVWLDQD